MCSHWPHSKELYDKFNAVKVLSVFFSPIRQSLLSPENLFLYFGRVSEVFFLIQIAAVQRKILICGLLSSWQS